MKDQVFGYNGSGFPIVVFNSDSVTCLQFYISSPGIDISKDMKCAPLLNIAVSILHRRRGGKIHLFPAAVNNNASGIRSRNHNRRFFPNRHTDNFTVFIVPGKFSCLGGGDQSEVIFILIVRSVDCYRIAVFPDAA